MIIYYFLCLPNYDTYPDTSLTSIPKSAMMAPNQVIKLYYNFIRMKTKLSIQQAALKIFDTHLQSLSNPSHEWHLFTPFQTASDSVLLLKLIEVPSNLVTSSQITGKVKLRYEGIIQPVDFFLVERDFQMSYYLIKADSNLISVQSYINLKREAGQKVQQQIIFQFLQFASKLQSHPFSNEITFKLNEVGITSSGGFMLTNYEMYFVSAEPVTKTELNKDIRRMLTRLLLPNQDRLDIMQLYSYVEEQYGSKMMKVIQQCLGQSFKASQVITYMGDNNSSMVDTTLSDSFHHEIVENISVSDIQHISDNLTLEQSLLEAKPKQKSKKNKLGIAAIIFVALLIVIGAITFKYLTPRPLSCQQSEYLNKDLNQCVGCDPSCGRCQGQGNLMCLNCKDTNLFLIKKTRTQKVGKCSVSCSGTMVQPKICIDNYL